MCFNTIRIHLISLVCLTLQACNGQPNEVACKEYLYKAQKIINTLSYQKLDSALFFVNHSLDCKENRAVSIELKATILYVMGRYSEGAKFIDSLSVNDFSYLYRKRILGDNFRSMTMDSISRIVLLSQMDSSLTSYINMQKMTKSEEENAFIDLFEIKKRYKSAFVINAEIDSLIKVHPEKKELLEKLRADEN